MKTLRSLLLFGCASAALILSGPTFADATMTVRQEIPAFANHYGDNVIVHDGLNLDAPVTVAFDQGLSSDQAITALSQAAGGSAVRVYFVTPATGSAATTSASDARAMGGHGDVTLEWHSVTSRAAIEAIAQAAGAEVRFPDGAPSGSVTFQANDVPLGAAIAHVAAVTRTRWTLGYLLEPTNPAHAGATVQGNESIVASLPPLKPLPRDAAGNILPFTIHISNTPPPSHVQTASAANANLTPQQAAALAASEAQAAGQQYYNGTGINDANVPQSAYDPTVQTFPGDSLFGGPAAANQTYLGSDYGTVQTVIPDGNQSGFKILPGYGY